uniref:Uncharacterized protein n=1 Tax=Glossina pallidipes TaxID=7398 RepID=A0A1A9ZL21_GLOPL
MISVMKFLKEGEASEMRESYANGSVVLCMQEFHFNDQRSALSCHCTMPQLNTRTHTRIQSQKHIRGKLFDDNDVDDVDDVDDIACSCYCPLRHTIWPSSHQNFMLKLTNLFTNLLKRYFFPTVSLYIYIWLRLLVHQNHRRHQHHQRFYYDILYL